MVLGGFPTFSGSGGCQGPSGRATSNGAVDDSSRVIQKNICFCAMRHFMRHPCPTCQSEPCRPNSQCSAPYMAVLQFAMELALAGHFLPFLREIENICIFGCRTRCRIRMDGFSLEKQCILVRFLCDNLSDSQK